MRFKVDENLPGDLAELFNEAGHQAVTVLDQGMSGVTDAELASICIREDRAIMTLDSDFADVRAYPPSLYPGIVVLRLSNQAREHLMNVGARLLEAMSGASLHGQLWIVEDSRIRIRD